MYVDLASLNETLVAASLPVAGVAWTTCAEARDAYIPTGPCMWCCLPGGDVRIDLTEDLDEAETLLAVGIVDAWGGGI